MEIFNELGIEALARYGHIIAGITWIGLLYYFNFVQTPAFAAFEAGDADETIAVQQEGEGQGVGEDADIGGDGQASDSEAMEEHAIDRDG